MFLKEPELNFAQISNNGNILQDRSSHISWVNTEVQAYPTSTPRGDVYDQPQYPREQGSGSHNFSRLVAQPDDVEMRSDHLDITDLSNGESIFAPYQDRDLDNNTRETIREHITDFLNYELKFGNTLSRVTQEQKDLDFRDSCGNSEGYIDRDINTNLSESCYDCQTDEALFNYEETERSCSSADITPHDEDEKMFESSDSDESYIHDSEEHPLPRGIHNPNYPGFQHLAYTLQDYPIESPNSYENSLFSNINIINRNRVDIQELTNSEDKNVFDEPNNNTYNIEFTNDSDKNYECLENQDEKIINLKRSEVISIPTKYGLRQRPQLYYEDDDRSSLSQISNEVFAYSDGIDSKETNLIKSTIELTLANDEEPQLNADQNIESGFEDDIIALQRDIYEEIQKPLANTIENISEVVNNIIQYFVEHEAAIERDDFQNNYSVIESDHLEKDDHDADENYDEVIENFPDDIKMSNLDDAYMSNVKEDLFSSQSSTSFTESSQSDEEMDLFNEEISPNDFTVDGNCNLHLDSQETKEEKAFDTSSNSNDNETSTSHNSELDNDKLILKKKIVPKKIDEARAKTSSSTKEQKSLSGGSNNGGFDVYNIETAMPLIDLDAIENHLRAAREEERRRRNDREEIRRRLAMGAEMDEFYTFGDRPGRKPSLQARLQSGMNLQICFMNETASDTESPSETDAREEQNTFEEESDTISTKCKELRDINIDASYSATSDTPANKTTSSGITRPSSLALNDTARPAFISNLTSQAAFFQCQARLQTEARMALAQAKEMARMQMEIERQKQDNSPITEMLRSSLQKAGVQLTGDRRRVSRQMLTDMNIAQLQVIVNELHTQIEFLNESLVKMLIARDELHMGQDSMLVDIEDLTRHLSAKELPSKASDIGDTSPSSLSVGKQYNLKSHLSSLTTLVSK